MPGAKLSKTDTAVVGGGPAGLVTAILLARAGLSVRLFAPPPKPGDTRTSALLRGAVTLLQGMGVWHELADKAAPLNAMRLIDDTGRLLRAPTVTFHAAELGESAFGYNIANSDLVSCLDQLAGTCPGLRIDRNAVEQVEPQVDGVMLAGARDSRHHARLVAGADGRDSICRQAAGIGVAKREFAQTALAFNVSHRAGHGNVSTEIHKPSGPLTFVPLPGDSSSVVWVCAPEMAARLMRLDDEAFAEELHHASHALVGEITGVGPRAAFPSVSIMAERMAARRIALVGESGHVLPPIGAQGLNLGLRDAAMLAEIVQEAMRAGADIGADDVLARYAARRRGDVESRSLAINLLNRSVLSGYLPLHAARGAGLYLLGRFAPLRRLVMELGLQPPVDVPALMRSGS